MTTPSRTGSVTSKSGKVSARNIITGIDIQAAAGDEVLKAALETLQHLRTGGVGGAQGVEASQDIVTGLRYLNPQAPDRRALVKELKVLRQTLAELQAPPAANRDVEAAAGSLDRAIGEAEKPQPHPKSVLNALREAVEFVSDAGKLLEAADKAAPLVAQAVATAAMLYQIAQTVF